MMSFNHFKKKLLGIFGKREGLLFDKDIMHPARDWFFVIFAGLIFLLAGGFWSVSVYTQFSNVSVTEVSETTEGGGYQQGLVNSALLELDQRILKYNNLKSTILGNKKYVPVPEVSEAEASEPDEEAVEVPVEEEVETNDESATPATPVSESEIVPTSDFF